MKKLIAASAATILGVGGLLGLGATTASAHDAIAELNCETWSVQASNYDAEAVGTVTIDDVVVLNGPFTGNGSYVDQPWATEADTHRLQVTIDSTDNAYDYSFNETVSGCLPEVPPTEEPPVLNPHIQDYIGNCDAAFVLDNTGSTQDVIYTINAIEFPVTAGTALHTDADGTRIEPTDDNRYVITTNTDQRWEFQGGTCETIPPTEEPPVTVAIVGVFCEGWSGTVDNIYAPVHILLVVDGEIRYDALSTNVSFTDRGSFSPSELAFHTVELTVTDSNGTVLSEDSDVSETCATVTPPIETEEPPVTTTVPEIGTPVYEEQAAPAPTPTTSSETTLPQTGNELMLGGLIAAAALLIAGAGLVARRKA